MKNFAATIIIVFSQMILLAQCPPGDLFFSSQSQIDDFKISYPNCTEFDGSIIITGSGFVNLYGLSGLTSIEGNVQFLYVSGITNLFGLENLISIGGDLIFLECYTLTNMMGLNKLSSIGGELVIYTNTSLNNVNGFDSLESIGTNLSIGANSSLTSISGMNKLENVSGYVAIAENTNLANIGGLHSLTNVQGNLAIESSSALTSLDGLESMTTIGGDLSIRFNSALNTISALDGLTSVGGNLVIRSNNDLTSLSGLDNIDAGSIGDLTIYSNTSLSTCEVLSICDYLGSPGGSIIITNNATGCDSQQEVEDACELVSIDEGSISQSISIYPNPASSTFTIETSFGPSPDAILVIINTSGQQIISQEILDRKTEIDISKFPTGIYFVKIQSGKGVFIHKLVVN